MNRIRTMTMFIILTTVFFSITLSLHAQNENEGSLRSGKKLFRKETFVGNGRTCATCHSAETGTVSPEEAQRRFQADPGDPLFLHDGSDDGNGHGVSRMLSDATILV